MKKPVKFFKDFLLLSKESAFSHRVKVVVQ